MAELSMSLLTGFQAALWLSLLYPERTFPRQRFSSHRNNAWHLTSHCWARGSLYLVQSFTGETGAHREECVNQLLEQRGEHVPPWTARASVTVSCPMTNDGRVRTGSSGTDLLLL